MNAEPVVEPAVAQDLEAICRKIHRVLQQAEADMDVGLTLVDDQKTLVADLESLLETLREYTDFQIHKIRRYDPPLTDLRVEARIFNVRSDCQNLSEMITHLSEDVETLGTMCGPEFGAAATICLIKAEAITDEVRKMLAKERDRELIDPSFFFRSDWN